MYITANTHGEELPVIIIDAGHGGEDGGAVATDGTNEKDINLSIAKYLNDMFITGGFKTIMTRSNDIAIYDEGCETIKSKKVSDMHNRLELFNSNDNAIRKISICQPNCIIFLTVFSYVFPYLNRNFTLYIILSRLILFSSKSFF